MVSLGSLAGSAHYFSRNLGSSLRCRYIVHHRNEISLLPRLGLTQTYLCRRLTSVNPSQRLLAILAREVLFSCVADREISTVTHAYDGRTLGAERPSQARVGELLAGRQGCRSRDGIRGSHRQSAGPTNRKRMRRTRWLRRSISSKP